MQFPGDVTDMHDVEDTWNIFLCHTMLNMSINIQTWTLRGKNNRSRQKDRSTFESSRSKRIS